MAMKQVMTWHSNKQYLKQTNMDTYQLQYITKAPMWEQSQNT